MQASVKAPHLVLSELSCPVASVRASSASFHRTPSSFRLVLDRAHLHQRHHQQPQQEHCRHQHRRQRTSTDTTKTAHAPADVGGRDCGDTPLQQRPLVPPGSKGSPPQPPNNLRLENEPADTPKPYLIHGKTKKKTTELKFERADIERYPSHFYSQRLHLLDVLFVEVQGRYRGAPCQSCFRIESPPAREKQGAKEGRGEQCAWGTHACMSLFGAKGISAEALPLSRVLLLQLVRALDGQVVGRQARFRVGAGTYSEGHAPTANESSGRS